MSDDVAEQQPQAQPSQDDLRQMIRDEIAAALRPSQPPASSTPPPHQPGTSYQLRSHVSHPGALKLLLCCALASCVVMSLTLALSIHSSFARLPCLSPWRSQFTPPLRALTHPGALPLSLASIPLLSSPGAPGPLAAPSLLSSVSSGSHHTTPTWQSLLALPAASTTATAATATPPFRLASSLPPVPAKLVKRIQALEFVEMRELLPDNMALAERLDALPLLGHPSKQTEQREIGSLITWVSTFSTYVAIVSVAHPERVCDMLAYMRLIVREAHKHGGRGWLTYDAVFRRNQQGTAQYWNILDPSLHTAYIAGQSLPSRVPCRHCNETDHSMDECALAPMVPAVRSSQREPWSPGARPTKRPLPPYQSPPPPKRLCISWNRGLCAFPGACTFKHTCALCNSADHKARDCARAPPDSFYRLPQRRVVPQQSPQ